jgi:hypothetical protein
MALKTHTASTYGYADVLHSLDGNFNTTYDETPETHSPSAAAAVRNARNHL